MNQLLNIGCKRATLILSTTFFVVACTSIICITASKAERPIGEKEEVEKLTFCGNADQRDISRRLVYVSTLDGAVTALDLQNKGKLKWSVKTNPGDLLSSSIHRLELTNNGQFVRMIPSLHGGLYKFDGHTIEQIPVTADHLLSSSFKFSDDLVISGGKETRSYGISTRTGQVLYECSSAGCKNSTDLEDEDDEQHGPPRAYKIEEELQHDPLSDDIIVVRRQTQTVRAVEPRTGGERWNFSVGHHELEILKASECHGQSPNVKNDDSLLDLDLKVIVPDGVICAVRKGNPQEIIWQYKFDHPIVNAWKTNEIDELESVDLFSYPQWPINSYAERPPDFDNLSPAVYIGMFNKQLYIQESEKLKKLVMNQYLESINRDFLKIPWNPYPATSSALALIEVDSTTKHETTAISVLNGTEYVNGNGFYLYTTEDPETADNVLCDKENTTGESSVDEENYGFPYADDDTPAKIIIVSLWFWWKEIMVISLTTALILNVVLSRRLTNSREVVIVERHVEIKVPTVAEPVVDEVITRRSISESTNGDFFTSRFQGDFDMVQCLGKGGFGVVFESKNKLDDCKYAIKRIMLPNRQESRERVMREVKTLAHCEHQNIVRYFQAWVETPPPGWQEKEDRIWMDREALSHSIDIDSPTDMSAPSNKVFSKMINQNDKELDSWISNLHTNECINFDEINRKTTFVNHDPDDSFIKFKEDDDADDSSFIQFKDDTTARSGSDSVFSRNNETHDDDNDVDDDDDSFDIEFKEPSVDANKNIDIAHDITTSNNDSFRIVFQKSDNSTTNGHAEDNQQSLTNDDSFSIQFKQTIPNGRFKQRTFSESTPYVKGFTITTENDSNASNTSNNQNLVEVLFKKTHRRPMSLDLTSRRKLDFYQPPSRMYLYIQMQLCKKQSLKDWLRLNDLCSRQDDIVPIFKQIVDGVEYCHLKGLIHRDLKPSNIFFSLDGQIKIGDFGLVTDMSDIPNTPCGDMSGLASYVKHTEQVGTHLYMSPEQVQGLQYNYKVDIYSLGLIFFELLVVFGTEMERIETLKALRMNIFPGEFAQRFIDEYELLKVMLSQSPKERPTTIGIRSRPPLGYANRHTLTSEDWHFELPPRRRDSHISGLSSNSSITETIKFKTLF